MAKATDTEKVTHAGYNADDYEWETVHEEAPDQLVFEDPDDEYVGTYTGHEVIDPQDPKDPEKRFIQLKFRDAGGVKVTNAGYELRDTFVEILSTENGEWKTRDKISPGTVCRIVLKKHVDIGQASPMKSFQVDTATGRANHQKA